MGGMRFKHDVAYLCLNNRQLRASRLIINDAMQGGFWSFKDHNSNSYSLDTNIVPKLRLNNKSPSPPCLTGGDMSGKA